MLVVGLGTQDDSTLAREFVESTGISSFQMLWDESFDSWAQLGVAGQPAWALFTASGEQVDGSYGEIDTVSVLESIGSL